MHIVAGITKLQQTTKWEVFETHTDCSWRCRAYRQCWGRWFRQRQFRLSVSRTPSCRRQRLRSADHVLWCTTPCRCRPCGRRSRPDRTQTVVAWVRAASVARSRTRGRWRLVAACRRARSSLSRRGCSQEADRALLSRPPLTRHSTTGSRTTWSRGVPADHRRGGRSFQSINQSINQSIGAYFEVDFRQGREVEKDAE